MAVDTTWTDPSTGGAIDLNTGGILTETIYDKILSNIKKIGGVNGDTLTGDLYTTDWTDYSGTSTIIGFTGAWTKKVLKYRKVGKIVYVHFKLYAAASGTAVSFTLPVAATADCEVDVACSGYDNSAYLATPSLISSAGVSTVNIYKDFANAAWTNSGNRQVTGQFWYATA